MTFDRTCLSLEAYLMEFDPFGSTSGRIWPLSNLNFRQDENGEFDWGAL